MNEKKVELFIDINYKNKRATVQMEDIFSFEKLLEESMKKFQIKNEEKGKIIFTFKDEQEDIIILKDEEDFINNSKEINSEKLSIEINLELYQKNKESKNNITNEEKNNKIKNFKNYNLEEIEKLLKKLEEKDNEIKDLKNTNFIIKNEYTKKINKVNLLMQNQFKDIIHNYINNESMNMKKNTDIYKNNINNENNEKDILEKKICIIENQLQNILSQIKEIDTKISKLNEDEVILNKKDDAKKTILHKERKNSEIENKIKFEKTQNNKKIQKDDNEKANNKKTQKEKQENRVMGKLKKNEVIKKNEINDKVINNNENEEIEQSEDMEEDIELTNKLKQFFYNENGELNQAEVNSKELEEIEVYYKSLLDKNKNIEDIEEYQNNYIEFAINPQYKLIVRKLIKQAVKGRIDKIKNILDKLKKKKGKKFH